MEHESWFALSVAFARARNDHWVACEGLRIWNARDLQRSQLTAIWLTLDALQYDARPALTPFQYDALSALSILMFFAHALSAHYPFFFAYLISWRLEHGALSATCIYYEFSVRFSIVLIY